MTGLKRRQKAESALSVATRKCDAWQKAGETLRAAVAWRLYEGKGDILSAITGVPHAALTNFVETGELDHVHRMILEGAAQ